MTNRAYNRLKLILQLVLPAFGAFYFGLAEIWNLPYGTEVVGSLAVINVFLGVIVTTMSNRYWSSDVPYSGDLVRVDSDNGPVLGVELSDDLNSIMSREMVVFRPTDIFEGGADSTPTVVGE